MKTLCRERMFLEWEEGKTREKKARNLRADQLLGNKDSRV